MLRGDDGSGLGRSAELTQWGILIDEKISSSPLCSGTSGVFLDSYLNITL